MSYKLPEDQDYKTTKRAVLCVLGLTRWQRLKKWYRQSRLSTAVDFVLDEDTHACVSMLMLVCSFCAFIVWAASSVRPQNEAKKLETFIERIEPIKAAIAIMAMDGNSNAVETVKNVNATLDVLKLLAEERLKNVRAKEKD